VSGCLSGAFCNPAHKVAAIYRQELEARIESFDCVAFAIFNAGYGPDNFTPFKRAFEGFITEPVDAAFGVLSKILENIVQSPEDETCRRLRTTNPKIASLLATSAVREILTGCGFVEEADSLVLPTSASVEAVGAGILAVQNLQTAPAESDHQKACLAPSATPVDAASPDSSPTSASLSRPRLTAPGLPQRQRSKRQLD